jgi:hypothetical protein
MGMRYMQYYLMYTFLVSRLRGDLNTIFSAGGRKTKPVFIYLEFISKTFTLSTVLCVYCRIGVREKRSPCLTDIYIPAKDGPPNPAESNETF